MDMIPTLYSFCNLLSLCFLSFDQMANKMDNTVVQRDDSSKTSYTFQTPVSSGPFETGLLFGAVSATQSFLYFVFINGAGAVSLIPIVDNNTGRTFTGSYANGVTTIDVSLTCWGGMALIWPRRKA